MSQAVKATGGSEVRARERNSLVAGTEEITIPRNRTTYRRFATHIYRKRDYFANKSRQTKLLLSSGGTARRRQAALGRVVLEKSSLFGGREWTDGRGA